jgi:hypothetical protein
MDADTVPAAVTVPQLALPTVRVDGEKPRKKVKTQKPQFEMCVKIYGQGSGISTLDFHVVNNEKK